MLGRLKHRVQKFFRLSTKIKILIFVSFLIMGFIRFLILIVPSNRVISLMGRERLESPESLNKTAQERALKVGWAIDIMRHHTPWQSKCLVTALSAQLILKILHIPSTLYLGVSKADTNKMIAHAWLRSGEHIITGAIDKDAFQCVTYFSTEFKK